jgi:3D (Asp-Asp-Asp) domain-containing protein
MLGFLVTGLLVPLVSASGVWRMVLGHTVYITVDGRTQSFTSFHQTVADVLQESKIPVAPGDRVSPALDGKVWTGIQISIVRALPLTVTVGGIPREVRLPATSVGEALSLMNVEVRPQDRVYPELSAALAPSMRITVVRRETRTWVENDQIPFAVQTVPDKDVLKGERVVRVLGQPGLRQRTIRTEYADGRAVEMQTLSEEVIKEPVARVIAVGTKPLLSLNGPFAGKEIMYLEATAYYPGPNNYGGGVGPTTAIGLLARRGVVAVDPSVIKLGSRVHVEGYGDAIAGDTGGAIRGSRIDLCFDTYDEAIQFGRRTIKVYILKTP